jgi:ATP/maltotriose-dependent transcriptional regulator MalT
MTRKSLDHETSPGAREERSPPSRLIQRRLEMPALPEHFVSRPRVRKRLAAAIAQNKVCVVAATAGAGKTSALVEVCQNVARKVAWLTVDSPDVAPGRLLTYLEASLSRCTSATENVATSSLAMGAPHVEVAGLLAESLGEDATVIVLDELERLGGSPSAWDVIDAFIRYAPANTAIILSSRVDPPPNVMALLGPGRATYIDDEVLAFTVEEASDALVQSGRADVDAPTVVSSTGGWVAGVLFHDDAQSAGGHPNQALRQYLAAHVIGRLPEQLQEFVVTTAVLGQVTARRAAVFGYRDAGIHLAALRPLHLPVVWGPGGEVMVWHSAIREYLLEKLNDRGMDEVRRIRLSHARLLASEGLHEEAVEGFLKADALDESVPSVCRAITQVVRRLDFGLAERWLAALSDRHDPGLTIGRLLIALARDDLSRGVAIADRARRLGPPADRSTASDRAAFVMIWCYLHHARWKDVNEVLATMAPGPATDALMHAFQALGDPGVDQALPVAPAPANGLAEVIINIGRFGRGQLTEMTETSEFGWDMSLRHPWRIAALTALGHTDEALREYRTVEDTSTSRVTLLTFAAPDLLLDAGAHDEARRVIGEAIRAAEASGSLIFQGAARLAEAKFHLRVNGDPEAAYRSLEAPELRRATEGFRRMYEVSEMWRGLALLKQDRDHDALHVLRRSVESMRHDDRILDLPTAAVYLAEAEWRIGNEEASDRAADLALDTARRQGSNHLLLQALDDVPTVLTRRLDAEAGTVSRWHELGRARMARTRGGASLRSASIELQEFGQRRLLVGGDEAKMPIGKSYELLAYLLTRPGEVIHREALLSVLFDDRQDASSRSYLRQTIRWLKAAIPENVLSVNAETVALTDASPIVSEATELVRRLAEAAGLQGVERLERTLRAIAIFEQGPYLPGVRSAWVDSRERELTELVTEARSQVAGIAIEAARLDLAISLARKVIQEDRGRESAWHILMRAAEAVGDQDGVTRAFRECERVLTGLGMAPSPTTRSLLERLRR